MAVSGWSDGFKTRFDEVLRRIGSREAAARLAGLGKPDQLTKWRDGSARPPLFAVYNMLQSAGLSLDWLMEGRASELPSGDIQMVQKLSFRPSAGAGLLLQYNEPETVPIPRHILQRLNLPERKARLLNAAGDSMMPTIQDGEPLIVEVDVDMLVDGKIYVFTIDESVYVKRLRRGPGHLVMISDNPDWPTREEPIPNAEHFALIGRVRWVGRTL